MTDELSPLSPADGREMYLDERRRELADATLQAHGYRTKYFVQWCEADGIDNLNDLTGRDIHRYRTKRRNKDGLAKASLRGNLATVRVFMRFCESIDAVSNGLHEKIILPTTTAEDARETMLDSQRAEAIFEYLDRYEYASRPHALLGVMWHAGMRIGAVRAIDLCDYDSDDRLIELVHRPDRDTALKNGLSSERCVSLSARVAAVLDDYLRVNRKEKKDEYGREPLFTTQKGRVSKSHVRLTAYQYTRPCIYSNECPHDTTLDECGADGWSAYSCPSSVSPHPVRRGAITHHLEADVPKPVVSDRMDVGMDVIDRHYDQRGERKKAAQRRQYLKDIE